MNILDTISEHLTRENLIIAATWTVGGLLGYQALKMVIRRATKPSKEEVKAEEEREEKFFNTMEYIKEKIDAIKAEVEAERKANPNGPDQSVDVETEPSKIEVNLNGSKKRGVDPHEFAKNMKRNKQTLG